MIKKVDEAIERILETGTEIVSIDERYVKRQTITELIELRKQYLNDYAVAK